MTDMLDINLNVLRHGKSSVDFVVTVILLMKLLLPRPEAAACPFGRGHTGHDVVHLD